LASFFGRKERVTWVEPTSDPRFPTVIEEEKMLAITMPPSDIATIETAGMWSKRTVGTELVRRVHHVAPVPLFMRIVEAQIVGETGDDAASVGFTHRAGLSQLPERVEHLNAVPRRP
jgi:hypothetical protein